MIADGGAGTVSNATTNIAATSLVFDDVGEGATLIWDDSSTKWFVVGSTATFTP